MLLPVNFKPAATWVQVLCGHTDNTNFFSYINHKISAVKFVSSTKKMYAQIQHNS
jgi:hypothetical protein